MIPKGQLCQRCKKNEATIEYAEGTMAVVHGFTEYICQECFDNQQKATPLYKKARDQAFKDVLGVIDEWEKLNKKVLKTEDIIKDKIIIADYIKWDKIKELKKELEEEK